jgi:hypothetical protein
MACPDDDPERNTMKQLPVYFRASLAALLMLAAVPAGKLAIADLPHTTPHEVKELEHAGCDAVIVHARDLSPLVGGPPPEV